MNSDPVEARSGARTSRKFWLAVFCFGAVALACCLVAVAVHPVATSLPRSIYWLAIGSAILCVVAAVQLRRWSKIDAAGDGAWLARVGTHSSRDSLGDLDGLDD